MCQMKFYIFLLCVIKISTLLPTATPPLLTGCAELKGMNR